MMCEEGIAAGTQHCADPFVGNVADRCRLLVLSFAQLTVASMEQCSEDSCESEDLIGTKSAAHSVIWRK
jgi:hypothetical protein